MAADPSVTGAEGTGPATIAAAVHDGLMLQRAGRHEEAERCYRELLQRHPGQPELLQLLGLALKAQDKLREAEEQFRRSLGANTAQPHVWNNLGHVLLGRGAFGEAAVAYREAVKLNERLTSAWQGVGRALLGLQDFEGAEAAFRQALALEPGQAAAQIGLAELAARRENDEEAERLLREVLLREPEHPVALHRLGAHLARRGCADEAEAVLDRALSRGGNHPDVLATLGYTFQLKGQFEQAIKVYRRALTLDALHIPSQTNLARLLWQIGRGDEFTVEADAALARFPKVTEMHLVKAGLLAFARQFAAAREAFGRALALTPQNPAAHDGMARVCRELGDADAAFRHHVMAVAHGGATAATRASYGFTLLRFGEVREAIRMLEEALEHEPLDQTALSTLTLALRAAADPREQWLADYEGLVQVYEVPPPRGYQDMAAFNRDLDRALDAQHGGAVEPVDQSLRNGTQTLGSLFVRGIDLVDRLRERLDETIRGHLRALPHDERHPYLRRRSSAFRYRGSWSVRLASSGYHVDHLHPSGWISSCYYVALPDAAADREGKQGWLRFGHPPFDLGWEEPVRRYLQPRVGMLVLFPSYFYHGTVPFQSAQARTTIAFDAVPAA